MISEYEMQEKLTARERETLRQLQRRVVPGPRGGTVTAIDKQELRQYLDLLESLVRRLPL